MNVEGRGVYPVGGGGGRAGGVPGGGGAVACGPVGRIV